MNSLPYYPRYPRDFFEGTAGMSLEEKGAYGLVLDLIYMMGERGLPDDPQYIAGQLGTSVRKWNSLRKSLIEKCKISTRDGLITNGRAEREKHKQRKYQVQQSENATPSNPPKDDVPEINSSKSGDNPEINSSKSGDNNAEKDNATNENKDLERPPPTDREEPDTEPYIGGGDSARADLSFRELVVSAMGHDPNAMTPSGKIIGGHTEFMVFEKACADLKLSQQEAIAVVAEVTKAKPDGPATSLNYFKGALQRHAGAKSAEKVIPIEGRAAPPGRHPNPTSDQLKQMLREGNPL